MKGWKIGFYWVAWIVCLGLLSCEKEALETPDDNLCLYIQVPSTQTTKAISDPGSATQEGEDWDRLAVIFVYEETNAERNNKREAIAFMCLLFLNGRKAQPIYKKRKAGTIAPPFPYLLFFCLMMGAAAFFEGAVPST